MSHLADNALDTRAYRNALGKFPTGVAVVTTLAGESYPVGMTINSFTSISLEPALVSWCIDRSARSFEAFSQCSAYTLSFLSDDQRDIAQRFATRGERKFNGSEITGGTSLRIPGACAWMQCRRYRHIPLGDHLMLVGQVLEFEVSSNDPLVFVQGKFGRVGQIPPLLPVDAYTAQLRNPLHLKPANGAGAKLPPVGA